MKARSSFLAMALGVVVGTSGLVSGTPGSADEHKVINMVQVNTVNVSTDDVRVNIKPSQSEQLSVHLLGTATDVKRYHLRTETQGDTLQIAIDRDQTFTLNAESDLQLDIALPQHQYDLFTIQTGSGDVNIVDIDAQSLAIRTESGTVDLEKSDGDLLEVVTESGSAHLLRVNADRHVRVATETGDLTVHDLHASTVEATTDSGRMDIADLTGDLRTESASGEQVIRMEQLRQNIAATSESGHIRLFLPSSSPYELAYLTNSGTDNVHFPIYYTTKPTPGSAKRGIVGQGGPLLDITTRSGDLTIMKN